MYSGTTFRNKSGGFIGVHQKINRVARRQLTHLVGERAGFPAIKEILHFEGNNGPDGIKRKSPSIDEPWHYIDPTDPSDNQLVGLIENHIENLANALKKQDRTKAAFEAAWLAHAIADGLTPAHHYPLSEKIEELWGKPKEDRLSIIDKNLIRGHSRRDTVAKNWEYWGAKGVFSTHVLFELGIASAVKTHRYAQQLVFAEDIEMLHNKSFATCYIETVHEVFGLDMYEIFWRKGWSTKLALMTRKELMPAIIRMVVLAWYAAYETAGVEA